MDFIDEEDGTYRRAEDATLLALDALQHFAHILHARMNGTQRIEGGVEAVGDDLRQGRLAHPRRSPEDERRETLLLEHRAEDALRSDQMGLTEVVLEARRAHSLGQGLEGGHRRQ